MNGCWAVLFLAGFFFGAFPFTAAAEENWTVKEIRGEVSASGTGGVAAVYSRDMDRGAMKEIYLPYSNDTVLEGYDTVEDVHEGDQVLLVYAESEKKDLRELKKVRLSSKKPKEALLTLEESEELAEERDPVL